MIQYVGISLMINIFIEKVSGLFWAQNRTITHLVCCICSKLLKNNGSRIYLSLITSKEKGGNFLKNYNTFN